MSDFRLKPVTRERCVFLTTSDPYGSFDLGDYVRKRKGSAWEGTIVGFYHSSINTNGYCVESSAHPGSVQIYPGEALELVNDN